jgi:uncharacterized membrane protein SirB2
MQDTATVSTATTTRDGPRPDPRSAARWRLSLKARQALLTAHIIVSVGLLGDSAGFLAVAIRAARIDDPTTRTELAEVLNMFSLVFGIPLSLLAILTGIGLGLGTRWGVFRYPWVVAKLMLIISVMVVGGTLLNVGMSRLQDGGADGDSLLIIGATYDVIALSLAVVLSVFKPGRRFRSRTQAGATST